LGVHAAVYGTGAAISSGLLVHAAHALAAPTDSGWPPLGAVGAGVLLALVLAAGTGLPSASPFWGPVAARAPRLVLLAVVAWSGFGALCAALVPWTAGPPGGGDADPVRLALLRTVLVAVASLVLAWLGRFPRFREAAWLVYPVLVAGGFKLILEDFLLGRAGELFGALGVYGAALIVAPRIARRAASSSTLELGGTHG
ncbi:MAG: hypothetical protein ACOC7L_00975, partial [Acidobacteriota bacterium]